MLVPLLAGEAPGAPAGQVLDGRWAGGDFVIRIDAERSQANLEPAKPFSWERFIVKNVDGSRVVFTIGVRLFMADVAADTMTITGFDFPGEVTLFRQPEPPQERAEQDAAAGGAAGGTGEMPAGQEDAAADAPASGTGGTASVSAAPERTEPVPAANGPAGAMETAPAGPQDEAPLDLRTLDLGLPADAGSGR